MEDGEDGHFDAEKHARDPDLNVGEIKPWRGFYCARAGEEGNEDVLPEGKEYDEFDGCDFQEGPVFGEIFFELDVELDQAVHGDGDAAAFDHHHPDVGEGGVEGFETVTAKGLGDNRDDGHEDADEAVLKYAEIDHLRSLLADRSRYEGRIS